MALEGGRELLNDSMVSIEAVVTLIIGPLKILVKKYDQALVGAAAATALAILAKFFELL
jgi:hypothetical protein